MGVLGSTAIPTKGKKKGPLGPTGPGKVIGSTERLMEEKSGKNSQGDKHANYS